MKFHIGNSFTERFWHRGLPKQGCSTQEVPTQGFLHSGVPHRNSNNVIST